MFAGVLLLLIILMIEPQLYRLEVIPILRTPLYLAVGVVGFYIRRSLADGALFVLIHLISEFVGEPIFGPYAVATVSLSLLAISGRPRFAAFTGGAIFALLLGSVNLKHRFAGSVLTWQDIRYFFLQFNDNVGVLVNQPTLLVYAGVTSLISIGFVTVFWRIDAPAVKMQIAGARYHHYVARGIALFIALMCAAELEAESERKSFINPVNLPLSVVFTPVSTFLSTLHLQPTASYKKVNTDQFAQDVRETTRLPASSSVRPADIVLFLQESQFNPMAIKGCSPSLCRSDLFLASKETTDYGELRVHTYGGGTWMSEFAIESGLPHTLYGRAGEYAAFNIAPSVSRSFVRSLKTAGYHTIAVYPVKGGMMNARTAYAGYGFDEFLDAADLDLSGTYKTPDSTIHATALRVLSAAQRNGKPVFLLAVTIFNHSDHGVEMERVPSAIKNDATLIFDADIEASNLADYVWRTKEFEKTYQQTRSAVLGSSTPTVLAWFGDHQPPFANAPKLRGSIQASASKPAVPDHYVTWYDIATNIAHSKNAVSSQLLDIVFLPGLLAQRAGAPLDDWLAANVLTRDRCGGLLIECVDPTARNIYYSYLLDDLNAIR